MKRCPECEFLYEDEQDRCDWDGTDSEVYELPATVSAAATHR